MYSGNSSALHCFGSLGFSFLFAAALAFRELSQRRRRLALADAHLSHGEPALVRGLHLLSDALIGLLGAFAAVRSAFACAGLWSATSSLR